MLSLHQLTCFLAAFERGSFTAAAQELGYAQPSLSEQIRLLERSLGVALFLRVGRGVVPTEAAEALRPHAERTLEAAAAARDAVSSVSSMETGTVRFGIFGTARLYMGARLITDVLERHPGMRVELIGQNSTEVHEQLRLGRLEAAMISLPVPGEGMTVRPVAREELVYVSADPERVSAPVTPKALSEAPLVLSETTWRDTDSARTALAALVQQAGRTLATRIEVEDVETAIELVGRGLADSVVPRSLVDELLPRLAPGVGWASLRPRIYETVAVVHRRDAVLSPATRLIVDLAVQRMREVAEPLSTRAEGVSRPPAAAGP